MECLCTTLFAGRSHLVWRDASFDLMSVHKAGWKVRLMSNTYMLQAARDKFNQHEVDPFCLLCRKEPENTEHFLLRCESLSIPGQSKKISNDQELIQSDLTSCPQNQKGNN